ncbi:MAG: hemolysin III family protein [Acidimicrobiia bacterium]
MADETRDAPETLIPRLRGVLHQYAALVWLGAGLALFLVASGAEARVAALVYCLGLTTMFGVSALYHRGNWSPTGKAWMRRADHSGIYLAIAGTYTPIVLLTFGPLGSAIMLTVVWGVAVAGVTLNLSWRLLPGWLQYVMYIGLGWVAVFVMPQLVRTWGFAWCGLLLLGGVLYTVGAVLLAMQRPKLSPRWFGYHELWHTFTVAAAGAQFVVVLVVVT